MPQTEQVADFVNTLGSFYELIEEKDGIPEGVKQPNGNATSLNGAGE